MENRIFDDSKSTEGDAETADGRQDYQHQCIGAWLNVRISVAYTGEMWYTSY